MNKKILAAACGLVMSSGFVFAHDDMNFYVGGDVGYSKHGYASEFKNALASYPGSAGTAKTKAPTVGLFVGGKFHENFGAEIGYTFFKKAKVDWTGTWNTDYIKANNIYADLLGYMPVDTCFDLIGSVGMGRMKIKFNTNNGADAANNYDSFSKGKVGFRLGAGAQYKFDDHFATRVMVRYQRANIKGVNDIKAYKSNTSVNLGLTYTI